MNEGKHAKRIFSMLLVLVLVFSMLPVTGFAAEENHPYTTSAGNEPIVLIAGGDYQQAGDHANSSANVTNILNEIVNAGFTAVDGFLFIGDYDCETHDSSSETAAGIESLMNTVTAVYSNLNHDNTILVQGNHDYPDSRIDATGGHDFSGYSVFVMNEDDYPNYGGSESQAKALAEEMDAFLAGKLEEGYTAPIFITSHVPLHFGPRTNRQGDGKYASYIFDVLNAYGAEGLNIVFMHGHNHAYGYDEYIGGEAIYLAVGDSINIAKTGSQSSYDTYTLNFTYMNAGYTGYYNESGYSTSAGTDYLTMTTFQIYEDRVVINRFSEDGLYNLKSAGQNKGDYISSVSVSANTAVYVSSQTITLTAPAERVTLEDVTTGVTVTGTKVDGTFDDDSDLTVSAVRNISLLDDAAKCVAYQAYGMTFITSGTATVTLPVPASYSPDTTKVYYVDGNTLTDMEATVSTGSGQMVASFTTTHGGTYAVVSEASDAASVYYARVESVSDLVSGEQYLIIFDCSSQTTEDAFVIPEIATYSSGSSQRKGPDVIASDGIGDKATITGDYDAYLWTLTKSGSGWLIGNGSQNINVTYNSTSGRCELAFTTSGETLSIAVASSNPSDEDSYSFAIYDNSDYYWQYNTSATLVYGTDGDTYSSRFCIYKRTENTASTPDAANGWVTLPSGGSYTLDTDGIDLGEDNKYIIVGNSNDYALTLSGGTIGYAEVDVNGKTVTVDDPAVYEFYFVDNSSNESRSYLLTQDGTNTVYHANGNLYYGSDNKGYWRFGSSSNGSYQIYDIDNSSWYLNYGYVWSNETANRFAVSSNARYVRLYKSTGSVYSGTYVRLAGETEQTYASTAGATASSVLENISIEMTTDGYHISGTVAVTSDMVTWNTAFDGTAAGTYTGTVTYSSKEVGTITVTVSAQHSYEAVTVEPTCTEGGYTTYTCADCGDSYIADYTDALGHSYETVTVEPTCTENGSVTTTCVVCGESSVEVIEATGHDHTAVVTAPTCESEGYTTYTCADCGDSYIADYTDALGHSYKTVTVEPTCTEGGYTTYTCTVCHDGYVYDETEAPGHDYDSVTVEATCTEDGYTTHTCAACGDSYVDAYVAALGHDNVSVVTEPTCETDGYTTHTCTICGTVSVNSYVAALGHNYEIATVEATCTEAGYVSGTCTVCGDAYTEVIESLGHDYEAVTVAPNCTEDGYTTYTCSICGDSHIGGETAALGHNYRTMTVEATCTENGSVTTACTACGDSMISVIVANGHNYSSIVTEPTCTEGGYTTHSCDVCGHSYVSGETEALGHSYTSVTVDPTCTEDGYTTHSCAVCGHSYVSDETEALGHSYTCVESEGYLVYTCGHCGDSYSEEIETDPTYTRVTSVSSGNNYVITFYSNRKYYALSHEGNELSVVQVTVSNGEITSEITDDLVWSYSNSKLSYEDDGTTYYLYASSSGNNWWNNWWGNWWGSSSTTLSLSTSNSSTVSFSSSKLKVGSYYLRYSGGSVSASSSASTTYLFVEE